MFTFGMGGQTKSSINEASQELPSAHPNQCNKKLRKPLTRDSCERVAAVTLPNTSSSMTYVGNGEYRYLAIIGANRRPSQTHEILFGAVVTCLSTAHQRCSTRYLYLCFCFYLLEMHCHEPYYACVLTLTRSNCVLIDYVIINMKH